MNTRADKWLHHVRVFKTRTLATQACAKGNVTIDGQVVKASRDLKPDDVLEVVRGDLRLRLRVVAFPPQRLGPPRVAEFCDNQTPLEWIQKASELRRERELIQPREHEMVAKPDKKQLRELRKFWEEQHAAEA
ncbi:RNA-binding S4 domain-containing protein [Prosthecobacter vanneervenii]|uniref:Ribosome-associated heat shock protein Hsp15 n=1 Tax=Prosthecobacter vanneervenii TaxID=48466 RepID=A0A7W8DJB5_9BACT|nr:S4 domain-containing protein [Prosthecobacter vanneervenii]MBB5031968.1 ribosome-associated heat shock protein Hsp15 [Prosthecobacter vanneervenii]